MSSVRELRVGTIATREHGKIYDIGRPYPAFTRSRILLPGSNDASA